MYLARIESEWEQTARIACTVNRSMGGKATEEDIMPQFRGKRKAVAVNLSPEASLDALERAFSRG